jgi:hypothetical protein
VRINHAHCKNLTVLYLFDTTATGAGIKELMEALLKCTINPGFAGR